MSNLSEPVGLMDATAAAPWMPPTSIEAESTVLGALLLDNRAWDRVGDLLVVDDFFRTEHRSIFAAIAALLNAGKGADVMTVYDQLARAGTAEENGGYAYLNSLAQFVPSASNVRRYAEIVRDFALRRRLMTASAEIGTLAQDRSTTFDETLEQASALLVPLFAKTGTDDWQDPDAGMVGFLDGIQRRSDGVEDFVSTGLRDLDEKLDGGMREGEVIVIAARPSMGKTALALAIGEHVASLGHPVGVQSMEMPKPQIQNRRVSMHSHVPLHKIKRPERMSDNEWTDMTRSVDVLRKRPVYVSDMTGLTINQVRTRARALKRTRGLRLLIVDYIGLMEGTDRKANRATQLGEVSRGMKALAKELGLTILLLAQLNREVEKRPSARPQLSDLRECGDIEQDADVILFVHRAYQAKPDLGDEWKFYAEVILGKQRDGVTGSVPLQYTGERVSFGNWPLEVPVPRLQTGRGGDL